MTTFLNKPSLKTSSIRASVFFLENYSRKQACQCGNENKLWKLNIRWHISVAKKGLRERAKLELNSSRTFSIFVVIVCNRFNFIKRHIQKDIFILMQYSEYRGISSEWVGGRRNIIFYCVADSIACACISMRIFEDKLNNGFLLTSFSTQRA